MPFDAGTVKGQIDLDARKFIAEMKQVERRLDGIEREVKQARKGFASFGKTIAKVALALTGAVAGFIIIRKAVSGLAALFKAANEAATEFELIVRKLGVSLSLAGEQQVEKSVEALKEWASGVQKSTAFSDGYILSISQLLATMGVATEDLESFTKAVLDYAAATGRDAVGAGSQFVKTLGGTLGELSETFPALKALTQEQLRAGEAFRFAAKMLGGFSEAIAETSAGIKARLENTIGDMLKKLGAVTQPFVDEMRRAGIEIFENLQTSILENQEGFLNFFRDLGTTGIDALQRLMEAVFSFRLALHDTLTSLHTLLPQLAGAFAEVKLSFQELNAFLPELVSKIPGADQIFDFEGMREGIAETKQDIIGMADAFGEAEREAAKTRAEMEKQHDVIRSAVVPALDKAKKKLEDITEAAKDTSLPIVDLGQKSEDAAESIDNARESTLALAAAAIEARQALAAAAAAAGGLEVATAGAARSMGGAGRGGGGGGGGGRGAAEEGPLLGEGFGRTSGGSAGFDLSTIGGAQAALQASRSAGRASVGGLYSGQARKSAAIVGKQIQQKLQDLTDQAFSDFTADILQELSRAGITDPSQRNQIVRDRIAESQRFGILPVTRTAGSFASTALMAG